MPTQEKVLRVQPLKDYLQRHRLRQRELARRLGTPPQYVSDILRGRRACGLLLLRRICLETGISADQLLGLPERVMDGDSPAPDDIPDGARIGEALAGEPGLCVSPEG